MNKIQKSRCALCSEFTESQHKTTRRGASKVNSSFVFSLESLLSQLFAAFSAVTLCERRGTRGSHSRLTLAGAQCRRSPVHTSLGSTPPPRGPLYTNSGTWRHVAAAAPASRHGRPPPPAAAAPLRRAVLERK